MRPIFYILTHASSHSSDAGNAVNLADFFLRVGLVTRARLQLLYVFVYCSSL